MAILPRLSEKEKSYIELYLRHAVKNDMKVPLKTLMHFLPVKILTNKALKKERSVISYAQSNYPGYLVKDFEPYKKLVLEALEGIPVDDHSTSWKITQAILSKDNFIE